MSMFCPSDEDDYDEEDFERYEEHRLGISGGMFFEPGGYNDDWEKYDE